MIKKIACFTISLLMISACSAYERAPADHSSNEMVNCSLKFTQDSVSHSDELCKIPVLSLRPTQFVVGELEVERKIEKLKKFSKDDLDDYLKNNPEPIVIGPNGEYFIIDHHHLARALYESNIASTYGQILENWNGTNVSEFWNHMKDKNWVYLKDQNGQKRTILDLSQIRSVKDLVDDPYRSLAGKTRCDKEKKCENGQWLKEDIPFIEFFWAEHFRHTPKIVSALNKNANFDKALEAAFEEVENLNGVLPSVERRSDN